MIDFVNYLIESGISLALFAAIYFVFLRKETFFGLKRWFLLSSVVFSAVLPWLHIPFYEQQSVVLPQVSVSPFENLLSPVTVYGTGIATKAEVFVQGHTLLGYVYLLGTLFFAIKFLLQLLQIVRLVVSNEVVTLGDAKLVVLNREMSPFSFLNYIFVGKNLHESVGWDKMLEHERQHIRQGHTYDVILLHLLAIVQWPNPFFWLFERSVRENHEFQADQAVISQGTKLAYYKQILINQYVGDNILIANNFNGSLIKIRLKMMSKMKSKKITYVKIFAGLLLAGSLTATFALEPKDSAINAESTSSLAATPDFNASTINANAPEQQTPVAKKSTAPVAQKPAANAQAKVRKADDGGDDIYSVVETMPEYPGGLKAMMSFIANNVKYPGKAVADKVEGRVYVGFLIETDGSVGNVKIQKGVSPELDAEALRVVKLMSNWTPGKEKGKPVRVSYTMPIMFSLGVQEKAKEVVPTHNSSANVRKADDGGDDIYSVVETMPEYPGGLKAMMSFIANNVKYPGKAVADKVEGRVYVDFVIETDGSVGNVKIQKGVSPELDAEALRVVKLMSNWTPGKEKGKPVRVSYTMPIMFKLS